MAHIIIVALGLPYLAIRIPNNAILLGVYPASFIEVVHQIVSDIHA